MHPSRLKRAIPGIALLMGLATGTALAMVPSSTAKDTDASAAPRARICSLSCKDCNSPDTACGPGEGVCGPYLCL
ncbi:hypothetical protein D7Y21_20580 [Corallococcus sp. AB045]|nr:hypothetical protein D7Y21_20580 [Corallococcus sp. AB045]